MSRVTRAFRLLNSEQKAAAAAAVLLAVSTFGPFSFVELAELLLAAGVLALLFARAEGQSFHLPFGDGTIIATAGVWAGVAHRRAPVRALARPEPAGARLRGDPVPRGRPRARQAPAGRHPAAAASYPAGGIA